MRAYGFLILALLFNASANLLVKVSALRSPGARSGLGAHAASYLSVPFVAGVFLFGLNLLLYAQALKRIPISVAYPVMVSVGYLLILVVSFFAFGERLSLARYGGAVLVLAGVWLLVR